MLSTNEKNLLVLLLMPPKLHSYSQDFVERTTTNLYGAILQCVFENHCGKAPYSIVWLTRIFGPCPLLIIIALEQNDNQAAHKLYLEI